MKVRIMLAEDVEILCAGFPEKPDGQYARYFAENLSGDRVTLIAYEENALIGYLNILWSPDYPPFRENGIPEIQDFNIVARYRKRGFGSHLMEKAEELIGERSDVVGIGVGMDADYGPAQRLYVRRGYVPDGNGLHYDNRQLKWGETVRVDDSLTLHFTKRLR